MADQESQWADRVEELKPVADYYKTLGLPPGADIRDIWLSWDKLRSRANPARFALGSPEHQAACVICEQLDEAYSVLNQVVGRQNSVRLRPAESYMLLRPSNAPPTPPAELLRPTEPAPASPPDQLLRSTSERKNIADTREPS